jgi:hypothetical protein
VCDGEAQASILQRHRGRGSRDGNDQEAFKRVQRPSQTAGVMIAWRGKLHNGAATMVYEI